MTFVRRVVLLVSNRENWASNAALTGLALLMIASGYTVYVSHLEGLAAEMHGRRMMLGWGVHLMFVKPDRPVMALADSQALEAYLISMGDDAWEGVHIDAPNFDVSPEKRQLVIFDEQKSGRASWLLKPKQIGLQTVRVKTDSGESEMAGISVTNALGLTLRQATVATYLGKFLGSALSIPWLLTMWEKFRKWKKQRARRYRPPKKDSPPMVGGARPLLTGEKIKIGDFVWNPRSQEWEQLKRPPRNNPVSGKRQGYYCRR